MKLTKPQAQTCDGCRYLHKGSDGKGSCGFYHLPLKRYRGAVVEYYRDEVCKADPRSPRKAPTHE